MLEKTREQTRLDELSTVTAVQTYTLPSRPEWLGVNLENHPRGQFVDKVKMNYTADPMLTIEGGNIFSTITPT